MTLLPTLNRISKLATFLKSAREAETSTPGLVIVDENDFKDHQDEYRQLELELFPKDWKIHVSHAVGMGDKVREVWPLVKDSAWVNLINDDHYIVTKNWDVRLVKQLNGKNFVTCNDRWNAPARAAGATMISMPLLECLGWPIFPPQINHLGIDDVLERLGRATGVWRVDMSVVIEHQHVFKTGGTDETHKLTYGEGPWQNSPAHIDVVERMNSFMAQEFNPAVERIKKFANATNYFAKISKQDAAPNKAPVKELQV